VYCYCTLETIYYIAANHGCWVESCDQQYVHANYKHGCSFVDECPKKSMTPWHKFGYVAIVIDDIYCLEKQTQQHNEEDSREF